MVNVLSDKVNLYTVISLTLLSKQIMYNLLCEQLSLEYFRREKKDICSIVRFGGVKKVIALGVSKRRRTAEGKDN